MELLESTRLVGALWTSSPVFLRIRHQRQKQQPGREPRVGSTNRGGRKLCQRWMFPSGAWCTWLAGYCSTGPPVHAINANLWCSASVKCRVHSHAGCLGTCWERCTRHSRGGDRDACFWRLFRKRVRRLWSRILDSGSQWQVAL